MVKFENMVEEIYKLISVVKEGADEGKDVMQDLKVLETLIDKFYKKYVSNTKFKNHIDIWNEWQKIEDKLNNEIGIKLEYAAPQVTNGSTSPVGKKLVACLNFQENFITNKRGCKRKSISFYSIIYSFHNEFFDIFDMDFQITIYN